MRYSRFAAIAVSMMLAACSVVWAESVSVLLEKGIYAEETVGDLDAAIAIYKQILDEAKLNRPYIAQAYYRIGICYLKKGNRAEAESSFRTILAQFPDQKELCAQARLNLPDESKLEAEALASKAWALWQQRKLEEAETLFQQAVEKDPSNPHAWNGLGWSQLNQGKRLAATRAFEKCVALESGHAGALNGLGWIAKGQGDTDTAIRHWDRAVEAVPNATAALNGLASTYLEAQQYEKAAEYYQMWLDAEPNNADAKAGIEKARAGGAGTQVSVDTRLWTEQLRTLKNHKQAAFSVGPKMLDELSPDAAYDAVREVWDSLTVDEVKTGLLKVFTFQNHPRVLDVLHLGITDKSLQVQSYALAYLPRYAFQDFAEDYDAYGPWRERYKDTPLEQVMAENCRVFANELVTAEGAELTSLVRFLEHRHPDFGTVPTVRQAAMDAGLDELATGWLKDPSSSDEMISAAGLIIRSLAPDLGQDYLRKEILPLTGRDTPLAVRGRALRILANPENRWAVDHLVEVLKTEPVERAGLLWHIAKTLEEIGDPKAIPAMIGKIDSDNSYDTVYGVGYNGLRMTGVSYDESHDGAWWRDWWEKNKNRYPEEVQALEIPDLKKQAKR